MSDLESPEVPLQLAMPEDETPKKKGFFKRLFSRRSAEPEPPATELPKMDIPSLELSLDNVNLDTQDMVIGEGQGVFSNDLPSLPPMPGQVEENKSRGGILIAEKSDNKSKGKRMKGQKRKIKKINESSQFDWSREIKEQEILIHNSNRFNQDVNVLMNKADQHIENKTPVAKGKVFMSHHREVKHPAEPVNVEELKTTPLMQEDESPMPPIDAQHQKMFTKISNNHQKLRKMLDKYLNDPALFNNRFRAKQLFKAYDTSVERYIDSKELELAKIKHTIEIQKKNITTKEKDIVNTYDYIKNLDKKLTEKEARINSIISESVERQLSKRIGEEKKLLDGELKTTVELNNDLKRKVKIIENDRLRFEREHQRMSESERKKLNDLQTVYEKKLSELDSEKNAFYEEKRIFEDKRKNALELIYKASFVSKNLGELKKLKDSVEKGQRHVEKELNEDTEMKDALTIAETAFSKEKENVDGMMFNNYIENNLKNIKPESLEKRQEWKNELQSNPLYALIEQCRQLLLQRKMTEAKILYNEIRKAYEQMHNSSKEKEALYTAIRELYNDIQLKIVEAQIHSR